MIKRFVIVASGAFVVTSALGNFKAVENYTLIASFLGPKPGRIKGLEEISRRTHLGVDLQDRRVTDGAHLNIRFWVVLQDDPDRELNFRLATMGARDSLAKKFMTWSGFPMGELGVVRGGRVCVAGCSYGRSEIHVKWILPKGVHYAQEKALEAIEGIVCWDIPRVEGSKLGSEESLKVRGMQLPCRRAPSGHVLVDVEAWCRAQDIVVANSTSLGRSRLSARTAEPLSLWLPTP
jgi:hypothetical protein